MRSLTLANVVRRITEQRLLAPEMAKTRRTIAAKHLIHTKRTQQLEEGLLNPLESSRRLVRTSRP